MRPHLTAFPVSNSHQQALTSCWFPHGIRCVPFLFFYIPFPRCSVFSKPLYNRYSDGKAV